MQDDAGQTDGDGEPAHDMSRDPPHSWACVTYRDRQPEHDRGAGRKEQRDVFRSPAELIRRVGEKNIDDQASEVEQCEQLDPELMIGGPSLPASAQATAVHGAAAARRPARAAPRSARAWGSCRATG